MIKLSSNLITWRSPTFTWPNLTGQSSSPVYFNHNQNRILEECTIIGIYGPGDYRIMGRFDRNGSAFYGHRVGTSDLNTAQILMYRGTTGAIDAYAVLSFY